MNEWKNSKTLSARDFPLPFLLMPRSGIEMVNHHPHPYRWSAVQQKRKCADPWKIKADALIRGIMIICSCFFVHSAHIRQTLLHLYRLIYLSPLRLLCAYGHFLQFSTTPSKGILLWLLPLLLCLLMKHLFNSIFSSSCLCTNKKKRLIKFE